VNKNVSTEKIFREDIQWLRGFSVLAIILFHVADHSFPNGYLGVNIFFIISGFVMGPLIYEMIAEKTSIKNLVIKFYLRRFFRLAPAFVVIVTGSLIMFYLFTPSVNHDRISGQALFSSLLMGNFGAYKFANNYFHPTTNPLIHLWSLSTEEQIYLIIPFFLILLSFFIVFSKKKVDLFYLLLGLCSIVVQIILLNSSKLFQNIGINDTSGFIFYMPLSHIWEFCAGAILSSHNFQSLVRLRSRISLLLFWGSGVLLVLSIINFGAIGPVLSLIWSIIFIISFPGESLNANIKKIGIWLGDRSYSIYLLHLPLLYFFQSSWIFLRIPSVLKTIIAILLLFILSNFSYKYIESRFRLKEDVNIKQIDIKLISTLIIIPIFASLLLSVFGGQSLVESKDKNPVKAWEIDKSCDALSLQLCAYKITKPVGKAILIGDSHAGAISRTFINATNNNNFSAYTFMWRSCPVISKKSSEKIIAPSHGFLASIFTRFDAPGYCTETIDAASKLISESNFDYIFITNNCQACTISELRANAETVKGFLLLSPNVIFLGQTPIFDNTVRFGAETFRNYSTNDPVSISHVPRLVSRQDKYFSKFYSGSKVKYLSTYDIFCGETTCMTFNDGQYLFLDNNHLSLAGASLLYSKINNVFNKS
jgi:peptidoglycan/LPS O-acetylase OafA/YrhL